MSRLFNREVRIIAGTLEIKGLRVQFRVKKTLEKEPNECELSIYNLNAEHRREMETKGMRVAVEAGYTGNTAQIFVGEVHFTEHLREGPDWVTKMQLGDAQRAYKHARVSESFKAGNSLGSVFRKVADSLGVDSTKAQSIVDSLQRQFTQGASIFGKASTEMDNLLKGTGLEWSIQDGELQVQEKTGTTSVPVIVLNAQTGLIGSPTYGTADFVKPENAKSKPKTLKIKSLLIPGIRAGGRVRLDSEAVKSDFKVQTLTHTGDTHGGDFYTEVEGIPLS